MSQKWSKEKMRALLRAFKDGVVIDECVLNEIEQLIAHRELNALGWAYADACHAIDNGKDYRHEDASGILARFTEDMSKQD